MTLVSAAASISRPRKHVVSGSLPSGVSLYLVSLGFVGAVTIGLFFGSAFLLRAPPIAQTRAEFDIDHRGTVMDSVRSTALFGGTEDGAPPSDAALSSTASEPTILASAQTAARAEPAPSSRIEPVAAPSGGAKDHLRKLSRPPVSRSDARPSEARRAASRTRIVEQERKQAPDDDAAGTANQQEYDQLHAARLATNPSTAPSH
jgi:hypothetical protein